MCYNANDFLFSRFKCNIRVHRILPSSRAGRSGGPGGVAEEDANYALRPALVHHSFTRRHRHARLCVRADWLSFSFFLVSGLAGR